MDGESAGAPLRTQQEIGMHDATADQDKTLTDTDVDMDCPYVKAESGDFSDPTFEDKLPYSSTSTQCNYFDLELS